MKNRIRFEPMILDSGQHAIVSPDVKGFCVVGALGNTRWGVEKRAYDVLTLMQKRDPSLPQGLPMVGFEAAMVRIRNGSTTRRSIEPGRAPEDHG